MKWWQKSSWQLIITTALSLCLAFHYGVCTQDDAFISFRYAENWANGLGLVFNEGEYIEGFSNPSWTLLFGLGFLMHWDPVLLSLGLGYLSIAFLISATAHLLETFQIHSSLRWLPLLLVGVDPNMLLESVQGLESVFYAGLIAFALSYALRENQHQRSHLFSTVLFALATTTRPEAPLFFGLCHLALGLQKSWNPLKWTKQGMPIFTILLWLLLQTSLRYWYYGDILPNTFYAKVGGTAFIRGLQYCWFHIQYHPVLWMGAVALLTSPKNHSSKNTVLWIALGYLFYVMAIGGDFKPTSRFLLPVTPWFAVMLGDRLQAIPSQKYFKWLIAMLLSISFVSRWHLYQQTEFWAADRRGNLLARKVIGDWLQQNTPPETLIAMHSIGVVPYYAQRTCIDMWGLTDRYIAKTPNPDFGNGMAGHEKSNPHYVFSRHPDIYLPEDNIFQPEKVIQTVEKGFPANFEEEYQPMNIKIKGSWLNFWIRKDFVKQL